MRPRIDSGPGGELLDGRYRVVRRIATGGMASVYEAEHVLIGRSVAIKVLHPQYAEDAECVDRFLAEGRTVGTLGHPNIVESTDLGYTAGGAPFLVLELLQGSNLQDEVRRRGPLAVDRALFIAQQIASALVAAHGRGVIHRDLKSANVFLVDRGERGELVKVLDFGISKFLTGSGNTRKDILLGTPWFMAPEQIHDPSSVDGRCDVYGLGVILYEMLTGQVPFADTPYPKLFSRILIEEPPTVLDLRPEIGPALSALVARAMAKSLDHRHATMMELGAALAGISGRRMPEVVLRAPVRPPSGPVIGSVLGAGIGPRFRSAPTTSFAPTRLADVVPFGTPDATTRTPGRGLTPGGRPVTPSRGVGPASLATTPARGPRNGKPSTPGRGVPAEPRAAAPVPGSPSGERTATGPIHARRRSRALVMSLAVLAAAAVGGAVWTVADRLARSGDDLEVSGVVVPVASGAPVDAASANGGAPVAPRSDGGPPRRPTAPTRLASSTSPLDLGSPAAGSDRGEAPAPIPSARADGRAGREGRVKLSIRSPVRGARMRFRGKSHRLPFRRRVAPGDRAEPIEVGVSGEWSRRTWVTVDRDVSLTIGPERGGRPEDDAIARREPDTSSEAARSEGADEDARDEGEGDAENEPASDGGSARPTAIPRPAPLSSPPADERKVTGAAAEARPARTGVKSADGPAPGTLDPAATRAAVARHLREVRTCFDRGRMDNPQLAGRVLVRIEVAPSGRVSSARVASSTLRSDFVEACIVQMVSTWTLPAPSGGVAGSLTYPFAFQ